MSSQGWELVTSGVVYFDPNGKPDAPTEPSTPSLPSEPLA
jgi:hypothetical protein